MTVTRETVANTVSAVATIIPIVNAVISRQLILLLTGE
jgi:hypothetical protein